jgi:ribose 5-phosphate isomerase A
MSARDEREKVVVAAAAAELVEDGMVVALGSGSTVAKVAAALGERAPRARFAVASPATEEAARAAGLELVDIDRTDRYDLAIDGADEVDPAWWLIKGGGGAQTRERIVAAAADRFAVVVGQAKMVPKLTWPVPLELMAYGMAATLRHLGELGDVSLRDWPLTADGGVIADLRTSLDDPRALAARLDALPGVVDHGLFPPELVTEVLVASDEQVERHTR